MVRLIKGRYITFNMASLWKLPVVFIIENNQYAMGTSIDRASSTLKLFSRGQAFNIPGQLVDGMDVLKVSKATELAAKNCRDGRWPLYTRNEYLSDIKDILCLIPLSIEQEKRFKILKIKKRPN